MPPGANSADMNTDVSCWKRQQEGNTEVSSDLLNPSKHTDTPGKSQLHIQLLRYVEAYGLGTGSDKVGRTQLRNLLELPLLVPPRLALSFVSIS